MRATKRIGNRHVLRSGNTTLSSNRRRVVNKIRLKSAAGVAAVGLLTSFSHSAWANQPLYTTQGDFLIDPNTDGNGGYTDYENGGWTPGGGATLAPVSLTTFDSDGSTTNGIGNLSAPGSTGTAGSLQITELSSIPYSVLANAPEGGHSQAFMSAFDPGSTATYSAGNNYNGAGIETAYSGKMQLTYTTPTYSSLSNQYGAYFQPVLVLNDNNPNGGYRTLFPSDTVSDGTIAGQPTYTATIPYTINAGSYTYENIGFLFNSNYVASSSFYLDNIQIVTAGSAPANWITNGNGAWESDTNWNPAAPTVAGSTATFDSNGGAITVNPTVTLSSTVTINSITFNTSAVSYTIANGGSGQINCSTGVVNILAGTHAINVPFNITTNYNNNPAAVFTVSTGASLTIASLTGASYGNVTVTGGGSLTVDKFTTWNLGLNGATLTTTVGGAETAGGYDYFSNGAVLNINTMVEEKQWYDDGSDQVNIGSSGSLITEVNGAYIGGTISGSGSIAVGAGTDGSTNGQGITQLTGNNANFSGPITVASTWILRIGSQYNAATSTELGNGSSTNSVTLDNATLALGNGNSTTPTTLTGTQPLIVTANGGTIDSSNGGSNSAPVNLGVGSISGPGTLTVMGGGTVSVAASVVPINGSGGIRTLSLGGLNINTGGVALATPTLQANRTVLVAGGLSLSGSTSAWTSTLDLGGNDLVVHSGSLGTIVNQLTQGYASGTWQGSGGILSTAAAGNTSHLTTLGVIQDSRNGSPSGTTLYSTFDGNATSNSDVLVKYTYYGDANLSGKVDGSDYSLIDSGFLAHSTGWYNGDFNYDGVVNGSDYTLIDNAFNSQGAQLSSSIASPNAVVTAEIAGAAASSVPEPATFGLIGMSVVGILGRRKQRRHC